MVASELAMVDVGNGDQRELGSFFQEVKELRHDYRNLKMIVDQGQSMLDETQRRLERELMELHSELKTFQAKVATLCEVAVAVITASAWLLQFWANST